MARTARRREASGFRGHPGPERICFHGQEIEFSEELRYLLADEAATSVLGEAPSVRTHEADVVAWKREIAAALDLFDQAGRGIEAYEWLVTPNPQLDGERPLSLVRWGRGQDVIRETAHYLSSNSD